MTSRAAVVYAHKNETIDVITSKVKMRKMYSKRKFVQPYQAELKQLSKELLVAKNKAQETFLRSVLQIEGRCWTEFYKYVKRR